MNKLLQKVWVCCFLSMLFVSQGYGIQVPYNYDDIVKKLIFFSRADMRVFYGGPIQSSVYKVRWVLPVLFMSKMGEVRSVYEIAFVNCDVYDASDAQILFVSARDIDIKLKNILSDNYKNFASLLRGEYSTGKYIVVRSVDVANVYYPHIYCASIYKDDAFDKQAIVDFLQETYGTSCVYKNYGTDYTSQEAVDFESNDLIEYNPVKVQVDGGPAAIFLVKKILKKNDVWKVYYVISRQSPLLDVRKEVLLRLDSGCVCGQMYQDDSCDCFDQLHNFLTKMAHDDVCNGIVIHMPCHDGRGFGSALKAETEIYKKGGKGMIYTTEALDTVAAARLLYGSENYDIRSFDGACAILQSMGITRVALVTDNIEKLQALQRHDINVRRCKTNTNKQSCAHHLCAKKKSRFYFGS